MNNYGLYGSTKEGEYHSTIDKLIDMTGKTKKEIMYLLYFLHDSQYSNKELKEMADLISKSL